LHQTIQLTVGGQPIQTTQVGDEAMFGFASLSIRLYNLKVIMGVIFISSTLNPNKHKDIISDTPDKK